jgi:hypothetical protein
MLRVRVPEQALSAKVIIPVQGVGYDDVYGR